MDSIEIRAANPDNDIVIGQLPELFESLYGRSFPFPQVYQKEFWKSAVHDRFVSLVVLLGGKEVIGHVALWADKTDPRNVQIALPAFSPQHIEYYPQATEALREIIENTANRQGWRSVYHFRPAPFPGIQLLLHGALSETAIFPSYLNEGEFRARGYRYGSGSDTRTRRGHIAHALKVFSKDLGQCEKVLFVPEAHREMIQYLYEPLKVRRRFESSASVVPLGYRPFPADVAACSVTNFPRTGAQHVFLEPSLLHGRALKSVLPRTDGHTYVFVEMTDPTCPGVCRELQDLGFRFLGVVPVKDGRESIVFAPSSVSLPEPEMFISERAQTLVKYIGSPAGLGVNVTGDKRVLKKEKKERSHVAR